MNYWDSELNIEVTSGTFDFQVVGDMTAIIDVKRSEDVITESSVQLQRPDKSRGFEVISSSHTQVAPDHGLTLFARNSEELSGFITYVDRKTGNWIYLAVEYGRAAGFEMPIDIAKGWFEATGGQAATPEVQSIKPVDVDIPKVEQAASAPSAPIAAEAAPVETKLSPLPEETKLSPLPEETKLSPLPEVQKEADIPAWTRKFCKDAIVPRSSKTLVSTVRANTGHYQAVLAPTSQLWDLGSEPLKYKFLDGDHGGSDYQKQKVRDSIVDWTWYANIKFQEAGKGEAAPIKIIFNPDDGSWSIVGNDACKEDADKPTMNLGWVEKSSSHLTREERAVILHEFGHALGMFHEHQSPAHGGQTVVNAKAAIDYYMRTQGWSEEEVMTQVVRPYNENDVSNFSQVDTKSIMHYYQPSEVTSGAAIEYNYVLSDLDKAYMVINYPRSQDEEKKKVIDKDWTLEKALGTAGLAENNPTLAAKILAIRNSPDQDGINVGQIRELFTTWAKAQHTIRDEELKPATQEFRRAAIERHYGLKTADNMIAYTSMPDPAPCQRMTRPSVNSAAGPGKQRAVVDTKIFDLTPKFNRNDLDATNIVMTWTIVADPAVTNGARNRVPGPWEKTQVEYAIQVWAPICSTTMQYVEPSQASIADLVIVFQDINPIDGSVWDAEDSSNRSYWSVGRWNDLDIKASAAALKEMMLTGTTKASDDAIAPQIPHDICYRGVVLEQDAHLPPRTEGKWTPMNRSRRTIAHELGHVFGLDHENLGFWCRMYEDPKGLVKLREAAKDANVLATVLDNASVMDVIRT